MKQKYRQSALFVLVMLCCSILNAQNANPLIHGVRYKAPDTNRAKELLKDAVEDVSKRTLFSSTWKTKSGKVIAKYSSVIINYPDASGILQPIDLNLHSDSRGWVADKQPNPCYFHSDRSTAINIGGNNEFTFNKNCSINGMSLDQNIKSIQNSGIKLDLSQGVHKEINFVTNGIETNYIFDKPLDGGVTVAEEVQFPEGCTFQRDSDNGTMQANGWAGDYILLSPGGKQVLARLQAAECYDTKKHWCFADYSMQKKDGKNILVTSISSAWLSKAVYPVTLDPLLTGGVAYWLGGSSPSCIYPNFHTDSIQVTIPANVTITFFTVDYAYVSSTAGLGIPTNDGIFYISTPCGQTDTTSCADSPGHGDTAGVCYLDPFEDFHNPMTCCYAPSCSLQKFWVYASLSRRRGGVGCDTSTIWYTKAGYAGFQYHFSAYVEGYTDSTTTITYTPGSQCSNSCTVTMNATLKYGVPPYKVTHPWVARDTIVGTYSSCASIGIARMKLTIPGCPYTCGRIDTIAIPPPVVVDACGDTAAATKPFKYVIKPIPVITPATTVVCNGLPVSLPLQSCVTGTTYNWVGSDNASGTGDTTVSDNIHDSGMGTLVVNYKIVGSANGCNSDTVNATGIINPSPMVTVTGIDTMVLGSSEQLTAKGGGTYLWSPAAGLSCTTCPNPMATPTISTIYSITTTDSGGCQTITPFSIFVRDENVIIPNIITPNGDAINDYFVINNLQSYPNSELSIFDRWGKQVYTTNNYQNNWNGGGQSDGVYFYILTLPTGKKYQGFIQLIK